MMKSELILISVTIFGYIIAILTQRYRLLHRSISTNILANSCAATALVFHAILLHQWIDTAVGQNLTAFNLFSLVAWCTGVITLFVGLAKPMEYLKIILFSLAIVSTLLVILFPGCQIIETGNNPRQLAHILISTAAVSVFYLAGLQALLLSIQEYQLRYKKLGHIIRTLPSLETMETLLFQSLTIGFILLTGVLASSFWYYHSLLTFLLLQKAFISLCAWLIFVVLFIGRKKYGWRGQVAARWTLGGVILVTILYFGSQFFF